MKRKTKRMTTVKVNQINRHSRGRESLSNKGERITTITVGNLGVSKGSRINSRS